MDTYQKVDLTTGKAVKLASSWRRLAAAIIDWFVVSFIVAILRLIVLLIVSGGFSDVNDLVFLLQMNLVIYIPIWLAALCYFPLMHAYKGQTLGKMALGTRVIREDGSTPDMSTAFLRYLGRIISYIVLDIGFIWIPFHPFNRGWHDLIAHTYVQKLDPVHIITTKQKQGKSINSNPEIVKIIPQNNELPATPTPSARPMSTGSLMFLQGARTGSEFRLPQGDTRIGRSAQRNDLALSDDSSISREHILIREQQGTFTLWDRGSSFGSFVNDRRVDGPVRLEHGDVITIGNTKARFNILAERV